MEGTSRLRIVSERQNAKPVTVIAPIAPLPQSAAGQQCLLFPLLLGHGLRDEPRDPARNYGATAEETADRRFSCALAWARCSNGNSAASDPPDPFVYEYGTGIGPLVTRPGWEYGYLFDGGINSSHSTLTIDSVSLKGPGVGTVIALADARLANADGPKVGQGNYLENPPVRSNLGPSSCQKQALVPVAVRCLARPDRPAVAGDGADPGTGRRVPRRGRRPPAVSAVSPDRIPWACGGERRAGCDAGHRP